MELHHREPFRLFLEHGGDKLQIKQSPKRGILSQLFPGDLVLADQGFSIRDLRSCRISCWNSTASIHSLKGKASSLQIEVLESRKLARVRIHVERLIGMVKQKYGILPISFIKQDVRNDNGPFYYSFAPLILFRVPYTLDLLP